MKKFFWIMPVIISVSMSGICQNTAPEKRKGKPDIEIGENQRCAENPDPLYDRQKILQQLAEILNVSVFGTSELRLSVRSVAMARP